MKFPKRVLTIAGSDSGGSAGLQADLKTFEARGVFGSSAVTMLTAQDTNRVHSAHIVPVEFVEQQAKVVLDDLGTHALKTGLLGHEAIVELVAKLIAEYNINQVVVDPVLVNGQGQQFVSEATVVAYQKQMLPHATVVTPNLDEARLLTGISINNESSMREAAQKLYSMGVDVVLIKGGHFTHTETVIDLLYDGEAFIMLTAPRLPVENPHGVGCTFAAATAAELAKGNPPIDALRIAHRYLQRALTGSLTWELGHGRTPVYHAVKDD